VANGHTLLDIAAIYGVNAAQIASYNRMANPHFVAVGQDLVIPPRGAGASAPDSRPTRLRVWAPYRSQFDGSPYEHANCGPATLSMLMSFHGEHWTTASIRRSVVQYSGMPAYDTGSTWEDIGHAARQRGFTTLGLFDGIGGYRQWTFADLMREVEQGRPVMLLVRFWSLPGHNEKEWYGDHYIVFLGTTPGGEVVYHDSAWRGEQGAYMVMSREQLERAWTRTSIGVQYSGMVLGW
jgi:LysM repeat protein